MSYKLGCPGCNSVTSGVYAAEANGNPCPHCGLPAETITAVNEARRRTQDANLLAKYEAVAVRAGRAEAEIAKLRGRMDDIVAVVSVWQQEDGEPR